MCKFLVKASNLFFHLVGISLVFSVDSTCRCAVAGRGIWDLRANCTFTTNIHALIICGDVDIGRVVYVVDGTAARHERDVSTAIVLFAVVVVVVIVVIISTKLTDPHEFGKCSFVFGCQVIRHTIG